jgi:hypothetical protein
MSWEVSAGFFIIIAASICASYFLLRRIELATHFLTLFLDPTQIFLLSLDPV